MPNTGSPITMICQRCNTVNENNASYCNECGNRLTTTTTFVGSESPTLPYTTDTRRKALFAFGLPVVVVALTVLLDAIFQSNGLTGWVHSIGYGVLAIFTVPLLAAWCIVFFQPLVAMDWGARFDQWSTTGQERVALGEGKLDVWVRQPFYAGLVQIVRWTGQIADSHTQQAAKLALFFYFVLLTGLLAYAALVIVLWIIGMAIALLVLRVLIEIFGGDESTDSSNASSKRAAYSTPEPSSNHFTGSCGNFYQGSNWFTEELAGRVDEEGNIYKGSNWFAEEKVGRIDEDGNIYKGFSRFSEEKIGRIDGDGNIHKGSNWFTEEKTGRIDEEGNVYKGSNWFIEEKIGRIDGKD